MRLVKLVRDKIPEKVGDQRVVYSDIPSRDEFVNALRQKLLEEVAEYLADPCVGELADILEVVQTLAVYDLEISLEHLEFGRREKYLENGGFLIGRGLYVKSA